MLDSQVNDKYKTGVGYHAIPPPYTGNFMPPKPDLILVDVDEYVVSESVTSVPAIATNEAKTGQLNGRRVVRPVWNNTSKVNHQNYPRMSNLHPKSNFVPRAVLMTSGFKTLNIARQNSSRAVVSVNTARPINTAYPRPTVNSARPVSNVFNREHSHNRRPFNKFTANKGNNFNEKVNTVRGNITTAGPRAVVSDDKRNQGNPQLELQEKGVSESGCSRHMTGNISYLFEYEEIDGGYVAFRGDPKGGKITGKGKISIDIECVVLSPDFKLLDESQVLLRVLKKNNMYIVDLKNVASSGGRKSALSFMRPFRYPITILNTIDQLGKLDGKADEGFFVGYSTNSKALRVFNSRTRIVEENLHVKFSDNTHNITGSGPIWLFDIKVLTKSMNYKPIVTGNQSNGSAGKARVETVLDKDYILLPLWTLDLLFSSSSKDSPSDEFKPIGEEEKKDTEGPGNEENEALIIKEPRVNQEKNSVNDTNRVNVVSSTINAASNEVNDVGRKSSIELPDDLNMPDLEDQVWTLVDLPFGKRAIGTKWIYRNKKDDRVARIEAIRLFLAYASFKDFVVYQMDVKSAFLYDKIEEEVFVCQPPGFEDPYDYAGASLDRKSTTGGCQFLGSRLTSWQCKKKIVVANSSTKAEYVVAANCCGHVLWIQNQMLDYGYNFMNTKIFIENESTICIVKNQVFHSKTKHIEIRHHFIRDSYEKRLIQVIKIHTDQNIIDFLNANPIKYALTMNPTIYTSCIEQLWITAKAKNINEEAHIHAKVDGKKVIISEATIRRDLKFEYEEGVNCLSNEVVFE
uniref:Putative ribonuclease H-like domain-containing protein n=1 Tax=Tanacetum cinerariifolium TaxID=118510 RepID=A0A699HRU3_TANCI|nr:putative ribonuclease H-like domain-containing protein [Tanacetum cinerariifolium]